ncbi:Uncharacterised protein [Staphylococcus aureus]|nr:Uncharacterised protein [Staphylococcus aureus]
MLIVPALMSIALAALTVTAFQTSLGDSFNFKAAIAITSCKLFVTLLPGL